MKKPVILYHANCPDGFGAAFAAWKKFGNKADYYPIAPNKLPPAPLRQREIYLLDNCYLTPALLKLRIANERVTVIDHHATNAPHIQHASEHIFDAKHSGAFLAWQYFHPKKKVPLLIRYLEDGDLWRFKLPQAKALLPYVYSRPFDFREYDVLLKRMESARERKYFITLGKTLADYDAILVEEAVDRAELVQFGKYQALAVNSAAKRHHSEVGNALVKARPPVGIVWRIERGMIEVSLRSDGSVDAGKLAAQFPGGGGHPKAAGFTAPLSKGFPWRMLESR